MTNACESALRTIYHSIPGELLNLAFRPEDYQVTLDKRIIDVVIAGRVLSDTNTYAGKVKRIRLDQSWLENVNDSTMDTFGSSGVYRIPPSAREGREITQVVDLTYPEGLSNSGMGFPTFFDDNYGNSLANLASAAIQSRTHSRAYLSPTPVLQSGNLIRVNPPGAYISDWVLHCRLGYDSEFTNISASSVMPLTDLIVCATKAYIYTTMIVKIDYVYLDSGSEVGVIKSLVESYVDENEKYRDLLKRFRGSVLFDPDTYKNLLLMAL